VTPSEGSIFVAGDSSTYCTGIFPAMVISPERIAVVSVKFTHRHFAVTPLETTHRWFASCIRFARKSLSVAANLSLFGTILAFLLQQSAHATVGTWEETVQRRRR
jgi:hypothetical protein